MTDEEGPNLCPTPKNRLKDAHSDEFKRYLAEGFAAAGLKPIGGVPVVALEGEDQE